MKRKKEREPELLQYRIEYSIDDNFPTERFFMSLNPKDALSQLCHICIKSSPFDDLKQGELDLFTQAFSNPDIDTLERPELLPVPDPIPDEDFPEPEPEPELEPEKIEEGENTKDDPDDEPAEDFFNSTFQQEEQTPTPPEIKPDPAAEHRKKQEERLEEIALIQSKNEARLQEFENLRGKVGQVHEWFEAKLSILTFEEYNRWIDKWISLEYPLPKEEDDPEAEPDSLDQ